MNQSDSGKSEDKVKVKRTRKRKPSGPKSRVVWLYAAHAAITGEAARRLLDYGSDKSIQLREAFGLDLSDLIIPVYPYPASIRPKTLDQLYEVEGPTFVILGLSTDQKNQALRKYYKGTEVVWIHPSERQFHISMMGETSAITYREAEESLQEWREFFKDHFKEDHIKVIRMG